MDSSFTLVYRQIYSGDGVSVDGELWNCLTVELFTCNSTEAGIGDGEMKRDRNVESSSSSISLLDITVKMTTQAID